MKNNKLQGNYITGGILIFLGVAFLLDQFTPFSFGNVLGLVWPLILCGIGLYLVTSSSKKAGLILIALGGIFFIGNLEFLPFNVWQLWPLILIVVGISILMSHSRIMRGNGAPSSSQEKQSGDFDHFVMFWGLEEKIHGVFKQGNITALFGGAEIDLREAEISDEGAIISTTAIFGGVELHVPDNVKIVNNATGIFGGYSDKTRAGSQDKPKVIEIQGISMFGGVEIK
ncbi:MAG: LiaI-LiaF-like domain-containing protein [Candidatus Dojkabacteria bacterium]